MMFTGKFLEIIAGIQWVDPFTFYGGVGGLLLNSSIIAFLGFLSAGIFINFYYKKYYGVEEAPKAWRIFFQGLILVSIYHLFKIPFTYGWLYGNLFISMFLIYQVIAVGVLAYGLLLMIKELVK